MPLIKSMVGLFTNPLLVALAVAAAGWIAWTRDRRRLAMGLFLGATLVVYVCALGLVGSLLLLPLERQYPPLPDGGLPQVGYVVVLGSGYQPRDQIPITAALDREGLMRIVEGVRLIRRLADARLIVSGGAVTGRHPSAQGYAQLAQALGIGDQSLIVLDRAIDTSLEARDVAAVVRSAPFLLVTSAWHMPRAVRLMRRAGTHPIPAPTGQDRLNWYEWLPSAGGLAKTEVALHEYLGLTAVALGVE